MSWKTLKDIPIDDIGEWVVETVGTDDPLDVHIGTDSLQVGRYTQFVTVVVIVRKGKGGRVAYRKETVPRISSLRERLFMETWKSVGLGLALSPRVPNELIIHIDANPVETTASSKYVQELVGLVVGQGFAVRIKPEAWASTHCADHIVRAETKGREK